MNPLRNRRIASNQPLPAPDILVAEQPCPPDAASLVSTSRDAVADVLAGRDPRFLAIVGPCSIHDPEAAREYAVRLAALAHELDDRLLVVMRVYFEKPRTSTGWKGLIMDPHLDESHDLAAGLRLGRRVLLDVLAAGLPAATEFLDPVTPQYLADLTTWAAIGARTTESQTHRQMASGLSMPVGFKNTTSGAVLPAVHAVKAARAAQTFLGLSDDGRVSMVRTTGNPDAHIILRGGENGPNCGPVGVGAAAALLREHGLPDALVVDASHANCGKDHRLMPAAWRSIVAQRVAGEKAIRGAMLESHLVAGAQPFPMPRAQLVHGQSITDPCIDWATTETLLRETHEALGCTENPRVTRAAAPLC